MRTRIIISLVLIFSACRLYAGIGFIKETFTDKEHNRKLETYLWYPSAEKNMHEYDGNIAFKGFMASESADISAEGVPLIILVHGSGGNKSKLSWLGAELAEKGALVLAADHPGSTTRDSTPETMLHLWEQPQDVSFLISSMLNSEYKNYFDADNIYVVGFSLGGYTAMSLAGAQLDFAKYREFCETNRTKACGYFAEALRKLTSEDLKKNNLVNTDNKVRKAVALAPGFVISMTETSLNSIKIPVMVIGAEFDRNVDSRKEFAGISDNSKNSIAYTEIKDASHFSFFQECKEGAAKILEDEAFVCMDGKQRSRADIHDEVIRKITSFLSLH